MDSCPWNRTCYANHGKELLQNGDSWKESMATGLAVRKRFKMYVSPHAHSACLV